MAARRKPLDITAERFVQLLRRDSDAEFGWAWRKRPLSQFDGDERAWAVWNTKYAGKPAGCFHQGHAKIGIDGRMYRIDRMMHELGPAIDSLLATRENGGLSLDGDADEAAPAWGKLAEVLRDASRDKKRSLDDLTVLGIVRDPYRFGTPKGRREGEWFADLFQRLVTTTALVHLRGFHYLLVALGGVTKPDGRAYENTDEDYKWMTDRAAKAARWLGLVGFDRFVDKRNAAPVIFRPAPPETDPFGMAHGWMGAWVREVGGKLEIVQPTITPKLVNFGARQKYFFVFFGEKSSLDDVLRPLAQQYGANMYLCAGEISDTLVHQMAADAHADGRPLVVFTFSDFDPAGRQMPVSIGRKLQALRDLKFPGLDAQVVPVSLTIEQVLENRLPTTPVKAGDKRRVRWERAFGQRLRDAGLVTGAQPAQVEIDALAALRPQVLTDLAHAAIAPFWDATLADRTEAVRAEWEKQANAAIEEQADPERLAEVKGRAEEAANLVNATLHFLTVSQDRLTRASDDLKALVDEIELPESPKEPHPEPEEGAEPLIDTLGAGYVEATDRLKAHKGYGKGETVERGDDDEEEGQDDED
jgi:hypothetical protein